MKALTADEKLLLDIAVRLRAAAISAGADGTDESDSTSERWDWGMCFFEAQEALEALEELRDE